MRNLFMLGVAAALTSAAPSAAESGGITYDCDTASGNFSELVLPAPAKKFVVQGKVRMMKIASIGDYLPITRIGIANRPSSPGQTSSDVAGFVLTVLPANKISKKAGKELVQFMTWDERKNNVTQEHDPFGMAAPQEQNFRLSFDGMAATLQIGDQEQRMGISIGDPVVRIICSTGEFLYTDLHVKPLE